MNHWLVLVACIVLAGCSEPAQIAPVVDLVEETNDPTYQFFLRVDPKTDATRHIDFTITLDQQMVDILNYESGEAAETLREYVVPGGNITVNVLEEGNRYLSATTDVTDCNSGQSDAVLTIREKSPGRTGLEMEYGCI